MKSIEVKPLSKDIIFVYCYNRTEPLHFCPDECLGYTLPKQTIVTPKVWAVHHDPKYWKDPDVFNPERFLNEEDKIVIPEYLIPFSSCWCTTIFRCNLE